MHVITKTHTHRSCSQHFFNVHTSTLFPYERRLYNSQLFFRPHPIRKPMRRPIYTFQRTAATRVPARCVTDSRTVKWRMNVIGTGPALNLYIHWATFPEKKAYNGAKDFSLQRPCNEKRQQLLIWCRLHLCWPHFCLCARRDSGGISCITAPHHSSSSCDSAQILSITVAPLSD